MRRSILEKRKESLRRKQDTKSIDLDGLFNTLLGGEFNPTQKAFIYDATRIKGYKGPAGCAKTSTLCAGGFGRALLQPGSKGLIGRYDYNDLMGTTAQRMEEMLNRLPKGILLDRDKSPPMRWWIAPAVKDAEPALIMFMGLKDSLGSYDFNWAAIDEADEVDEARIHEVNTRLRATGGNYALSLAFNPPPKTHWLYPACTGKDFQENPVKDAWIKCFEPQPRENVANLPDNYYEELSKSLPEDMKQRLVDGEWGSSFAGQPVYREFKYLFHSQPNLEWSPYRTLFRFWDFGYNRPACIWAQVDALGRLLILREKIGHMQEAAEFIAQCKPLTATWFPGLKEVHDYGDPAVNQQKDTGKTLSVFIRAGINMMWRSSSIKEGTDLIRRRLSTVIDGEPAVQIDRRHCPVVCDAFKGGYRLDRFGEKPHKDGFYEHPMDAVRYGFINLFGGGGLVLGSKKGELPESIAYRPEADVFRTGGE